MISSLRNGQTERNKKTEIWERRERKILRERLKYINRKVLCLLFNIICGLSTKLANRERKRGMRVVKRKKEKRERGMRVVKRKKEREG